MKVRAIVALKAEHRLELLLQVAGLARSTFFYHQAKLHDPDRHAALKEAIGDIFATNHGRYGHRRIHQELTNQGWTVAKKTVLKCMQEQRLVCPVRRKRPYVSYQGQIGKAAPNTLDRDFSAQAPNCKWVTDVTEFHLGQEKLYLSAIMDLFDSQIISYTLGVSPSLDLTNRSLRNALERLSGPVDLIVHSDQGFQYRHQSWQEILAQAGARQSMSRKGNCYDNAVIENFFGHLKEEAFNHSRYTSINELQQALHEYIHWYNTKRISTKLKGLSPVQYRAQTLAA